MTKYCDVCKQIMKCQYCIKYGSNGILVYLEKQFIETKKNNLEKQRDYLDGMDIHKLQLSRFHKS